MPPYRQYSSSTVFALALIQDAQNAAGDPALEELRSLPFTAHLLVAVMMICGLILWLVGRRVLKPMVVTVFALVGSVTGFLLGPLIPFLDSLSVYVGLGVGLILGAVVGFMLYRFAMATGFAIVLGMAAPMAAAIVIGTRPPPPSPPDPDNPQPTARQQLLKDLDEVRTPLKDIDAADGAAQRDAVEQAVRTAGERTRAFAEAAGTDFSQAWQQIPPRDRLILVASGAVGLLAGVIAGLFLPAWAAGAVTAMLGAAVWMPAAVWLCGAAGLPRTPFMDRTAGQWLIVWAGMSAVGMLLQWRGLIHKRAKKADKEKKKDT